MSKTRLTRQQLQELTKDYDAIRGEALVAIHRLHVQMEQHRERSLREMANGSRAYGMGDMRVVRNEADSLCTRLREGIDR